MNTFNSRLDDEGHPDVSENEIGEEPEIATEDPTTTTLTTAATTTSTASTTQQSGKLRNLVKRIVLDLDRAGGL